MILTDLDEEETARAVADLMELPRALQGARLVGSIGPRVKNQRSGPNSVSTFRYLLPDGTQTKVTHSGDHHLQFIQEESDGPTRRIELEEVLFHRSPRTSLAVDAEKPYRAVQAFVDGLDQTWDPGAVQTMRTRIDGLCLLMRMAMIETIGRRATDSIALAVSGRPPSLSIWDSKGSSTWRLSDAGIASVNAMTGSVCKLTRKTAGGSDWKFARCSVKVATNAQIDELDGMERLRLILEARDLVASAPFVQVRIGEEWERQGLS